MLFPPFRKVRERMGHPFSAASGENKYSEVFDVVQDLGIGPVLRADELAADFTLPVDDVGLGRTGGAEGQVALLRFIMDGEQVDMIVAEELVIGVDVVVEIDGKHNDLRQLLLEGDQRGQFFKAGSAPGGPEIEDQGFAAVIAEVDCLCAVDDGEVGSRFG